MTVITAAEIVALCLVILVLSVGTVIIFVRCFRSIKQANKPNTTLRHTPELGFHVSYFDTMRQSFRWIGKRNNETETTGQTETTVTIPRVHVATVEDLINERSDIHPQYLDKSDSARTVKMIENSPFESQASYERFENEQEDEEGVVNILQFKQEKFEGIENAGYAMPATKEPREKYPASKFPSAHFSDQCPSDKSLPGFEKLAFPFEKLTDEEISKFKAEFENFEDRESESNA